MHEISWSASGRVVDFDEYCVLFNILYEFFSEISICESLTVQERTKIRLVKYLVVVLSLVSNRLHMCDSACPKK